MTTFSFNNSAALEFQGTEVFNLVDIKKNSVEYEVIGFEEPKLRVRDYRNVGRMAIDKVVTTGDVTSFAEEFNTPSHVIIRDQKEENAVVIELHETQADEPQFMLWLAIGIENDIPLYNYQFPPVIQSYNNNRLSIFSIYKRPSDKSREQ